MKIYAHRGFSHKYPEASRLAYEKAIEVGSTGLECDVRLTRDGIAICFHDRTTERLANRNMVVSKSSFAELNELVSPLRLDELIDIAERNGVNLLIETKHPVRTSSKVEKVVLKRVLQHKGNSRITLMSFSLVATLRMKQKYPDVGYVISHLWRALYIPTKLVAVDIELLKRSKYVRNRLRGKEIFVWTVNNPAELAQLKGCEISAVITDRPNLDF